MKIFSLFFVFVMKIKKLMVLVNVCGIKTIFAIFRSPLNKLKSGAFTLEFKH